MKFSRKFKGQLESLLLKLISAVVISVLSWVMGNLKGWKHAENDRKELAEALDFTLDYYR